MTKTGGIIIGCLAVIAVPLVYWNWVRTPEPDARYDAFMRQMAGPARVPQWREVARQPLVSDSDDFQNSMMYQDDGHTPNPSRRWTIEGRWAASAPVLFVVMDEANYARLQKGFPPFLIFSQAKSPVRFAAPAQSFWYGFVALPPPQPATREPAKLPASIPELLLFILRQGVQAPPIRLSCDFWQVEERQ